MTISCSRDGLSLMMNLLLHIYCYDLNYHKIFLPDWIFLPLHFLYRFRYTFTNFDQTPNASWLQNILIFRDILVCSKWLSIELLLIEYCYNDFLKRFTSQTLQLLFDIKVIILNINFNFFHPEDGFSIVFGVSYPLLPISTKHLTPHDTKGF